MVYCCFHVAYDSDIYSSVIFLNCNNINVTHIIGHSMAANAVTMYAADLIISLNNSDNNHNTTPQQSIVNLSSSLSSSASASSSNSFLHISYPKHFIILSPRYNMSIDPRFNIDWYKTLIKNEINYWNIGKNNNNNQSTIIPITLQSYQQRLRLDMNKYGNIIGNNQYNIHTLLLHGKNDQIISCEDSYELHSVMINSAKSIHKIPNSNSNSDSNSLSSASSYIFSLPTSQMSNQQLNYDDFAPNLINAPHTFIPLENVNHNYDSINAFNIMSQIIVLWMKQHWNEEKISSSSSIPVSSL